LDPAQAISDLTELLKEERGEAKVETAAASAAAEKPGSTPRKPTSSAAGKPKAKT
jgi:hypothetical protein